MASAHRGHQRQHISIQSPLSDGERRMDAGAHQEDVSLPCIPKRLHGVDLKQAEQLVRRLILYQPFLPSYVRPPPLPQHASHTVKALLNDPSTFANILPPSIDPAWRAHESSPQRNEQQEKISSSGVPPLRAARKRAQILALLEVVVPILLQTPNATVYDFCAGCGHVGLVVATLFPDASVTLVDTRAVPLQIAKLRAEAANLSNLEVLNSRVEELAQDITFDVALGLHACGAASDAILAQAAKRRAAIVLAPCCVGAVCNSSVIPQSTTVPNAVEGAHARSEIFASMISTDEYNHLARAADFGEASLQRDEWRFVAKSLVEHDRLQSLHENGYSETRLVKMRPTDCTPKNDVIVAWCSKIDNPTDEATWPLDHIANGLFTDFLDASVLNGLGIAEVRVVEDTLRKHVCAQDAPGVYNSPCGCGKRARKVVHAVAESLALVHDSVGRGADRHVVVRRHVHWPLFFDCYVGIGGPHIDRLGERLSEFVPTQYVQRRQFVRGAPHHLTIISPKEISFLPSQYKLDRKLCIAEIYNDLNGTSFLVKGVGRVRKDVSVSRPSGKMNGSGARGRKVTELIEHVQVEETHFAIVEWPAAQAVRYRFGLSTLPLHITLGFKNKDVHGVDKDASTITRISEHTCSPWLIT